MLPKRPEATNLSSVYKIRPIAKGYPVSPNSLPSYHHPSCTSWWSPCFLFKPERDHLYSPYLINAIRPINPSSVSNEPALRQTRSGGRSSASRTRSKVFRVPLPSLRGRMERAPNCSSHIPPPHLPHITRHAPPKTHPHSTPEISPPAMPPNQTPWQSARSARAPNFPSIITS